MPCPAISVIIPLYNAEQFIGECLESVLHQTFQSFEVIVVDDCSTDNSVEIVESYIPKFDGRLRLTKTEKNSGGGGEPRNIGINLAIGKYICLLDADDFILLTALETLYNAAEEYNADVVYTSAYFKLRAPINPFLYRDGEGKKLIRDGLEDKPDLRVDDQKGNLSKFLLEESEGNFRNPWSKFLRRDFLFKNKIEFPKMSIGEDFIWVINVYCNAKRFLRFPMPLYFYRGYNTTSVTQDKRKPDQQLSRWVSVFVDFLKSLRALENSNEILSENPAYCLAALKSHFGWCLSCIQDARKDLTNQEIYETLYREFAKNPSDSAVPFLFSVIDADKKNNDARQQTIKKLEREIAQSKKIISLKGFPAVSVIIPLYNAEKYIGECLDSLLAQTFQNFEVVVVDDCSTDNSVKIVERYMSKFNGRLTLAKMDKNSGSGGLPRNKAIMLSCGEYIQNLDADDTLTKTALEELYTLAKDYDADVVYCEKYYNTDEDGSNIQSKTLQKGALVKVPTFETEDLEERTAKTLRGLFVVSTCFKFVRRKLILQNEIFFPHTCPAEDDIWTYGLVFYAKKFLRVPNAVYIRRISDNSVMKKKRTPQQTINFWLNPVLFGLKYLDNLMNKHEFFQENPSLRYAILKMFLNGKFNLKSAQELTEDEIYSAIKNEFGERLGEYDVLIPALCTAIYNEKKALADEKKAHDDDLQVIRKLAPYITARIDIKLFPKTEGGDFQILSTSDDKVFLIKPDWFQKGGIGYQIQSNVGNLTIVAKATVDGQIQLALRGWDFRNPKDRTKRIPYWIDYTKLTINGRKIFNTLTPAWHNKSYRHNMEAKADEEITIEVEWLPHRSDT